MKPSIPKFIIPSLISLHFQASSVLANTEKTIFLGPETVRVPSQHPTLSDLHLEVLTPQDNNWSLRTSLPRQFPNTTHPDGLASWFLLDDLTPDQRYEVRVCWAATQPTAFTLKTYTLDKVFSSPDLISSLNEYSLTRQSQSLPSSPQTSHEKERFSSLLLLKISSRADYFTTNSTLMTSPPPVDVDIILDPFLLNILPRSLVPTVIYIILVGIVAYLISGKVLLFLDDALGLVKPTAQEKKKNKKKKTN
ncbi:hypothetical protein V8F20_000215 [Naviculisporaceae sp. PSN 640]